MKWPNHPNLQKGPHSPAKGRGRLQVQIRRALLATVCERRLRFTIGVIRGIESGWSAAGNTRFGASCVRSRSQSAARRRSAGRGCGGSKTSTENKLWRNGHPRRQAEIIVELGVLPILPILQTMFKKEIRAIVAGSDHFIRRLLHEPDIVAVLPDNGGAGWF